MDNATNNDTAMEFISQQCSDNGVIFTPRDARMRCMPHIIHLAALEVNALSQVYVLCYVSH